MTIRDIRLYGDPVLTLRATEIDQFDDALVVLANDMLETMDAAGGVGLAGNQIGVAKRIFVYDCTAIEAGLRGAIVNPRWWAVGSEMALGEEGCLSIPGLSALTARHHRVAVTGRDVYGREVGMIASGLLARCIQHETDHLDGVLFFQRLEPPARKEAMAIIRRADWFNAGNQDA